MKTPDVMIYMVIGLASLFMNCHKDTTKPQNREASEYFPNTVGDYWEYEVYDSSYVRDHPNLPRKYTVKVSIVGIKKLVDGGNAYVWQYKLPYGNEIKYFRKIKDTIKVFDTIYSKTVKNLEYPREIYLLPFQIDKNWHGRLLYVDNYYVNQVQNIITPFHIYKDCFNIYRHYIGPNIEYNDHYWYKPKIGFVKIYYNQNNLGPKLIQIWQLKHYSLK